MKGMTVIVKTISGWVKVLILLFGVYIVLFGDVTPGGGFAGGVLLAGAYVLLMLAFGGQFVEKNLPLSLALKLTCLGVLAFAALAVAGLFFPSGAFFWNFIHQYFEYKGVESGMFNAGNIALAEIFIGVLVGSALFLVIISLSKFRPESSGEKKE